MEGVGKGMDGRKGGDEKGEKYRKRGRVGRHEYDVWSHDVGGRREG